MLVHGNTYFNIYSICTFSYSAVNCPDLAGPANGQVVPSGSIPASTATYTCNSGYRLNGDSSRTCQDSGEWSGTAPTCEPSTYVTRTLINIVCRYVTLKLFPKVIC